MKIKLGISFILILAFSLKGCGYQIPREERLVDEIIAKTAKAVQKEYGLQPCGSGASMPGGPIRSINICFDSRKLYNKDQLRELLINIAKTMILEVSKNKEIQQFIHSPPFDESNVEIIIYNHGSDGTNKFDPEICVAQIFDAGLVYRTLDPINPLRYKNRYSETYEEALELLKISNINN